MYKSWASYQDGPLLPPARLLVAEVSSEDAVVTGGSIGTDFNGSGLTPRWISKSADGRQGRARDARFMAPAHNIDEYHAKTHREQTQP